MNERELQRASFALERQADGHAYLFRGKVMIEPGLREVYGEEAYDLG